MIQAWHASEQAPQDVVWERLQRRAAGRGRHSDSTAAMQRMQPRARVVIVSYAAYRALQPITRAVGIAVRSDPSQV